MYPVSSTLFKCIVLYTCRVLTKVLKWWVPGLITFENGESNQILVSPNPKMMSPDFLYNKPLSESLIFHKTWVHAVSFKCIYKTKINVKV